MQYSRNLRDRDGGLLEIALFNLIDNAWKFSKTRPVAHIEFGRTEADSRSVYFVRDNGVGFDMTYAHKLFGAFQRLHKASGRRRRRCRSS